MHLPGKLITHSRILYTIPKIAIPNGRHPEWIPFRMDTINVKVITIAATVFVISCNIRYCVIKL